MTTRPRRSPHAPGHRLLGWAAAVTMGLTSLVSCTAGPQDDSAATPTTASEAPSRSSSPTVAPSTPSPSASPTVIPSEPASSTPPAAPTTLAGRLLSAAELPGFDARSTWRDGATRSGEPSQPVNPCQRFSLQAIGAERTAYRSYLPASGTKDTAAELVAQFPDSTTASRAYSVLQAWRARCQSQLRHYDQAYVGDLKDVSVDAGTSAWYLLTYGPAPAAPDSAYFDAQGIAQVGNRVAMVSMRLVGQEYTYKKGQEPMVAAVRAAAAKLGGGTAGGDGSGY
jgi:hypothetical protein